ncbi:hypothetical protein [Stakelama tenebrarum]|uniref:Uncharacterized protein n=1 Tax=Stakelama tenebrarum TaxID=2711215 RepID=A0A6G6Y5C4_9SPHN|nr:hypothetical protein [Sphingosinithalassobacter tenebrarum]QIG80099.1 hypothetical protein G5C33_10125 [Sphingosinithalassobacter tenebrarum]
MTNRDRWIVVKRAAARVAGTFDRRDMMIIAGIGALAHGAGMAWEPAGWIVPGAIVTALAMFGGRNAG